MEPRKINYIDPNEQSLVVAVRNTHCNTPSVDLTHVVSCGEVGPVCMPTKSEAGLVFNGWTPENDGDYFRSPFLWDGKCDEGNNIKNPEAGRFFETTI